MAPKLLPQVQPRQIRYVRPPPVGDHGASTARRRFTDHSAPRSARTAAKLSINLIRMDNHSPTVSRTKQRLEIVESAAPLRRVHRCPRRACGASRSNAVGRRLGCPTPIALLRTTSTSPGQRMVDPTLLRAPAYVDESYCKVCFTWSQARSQYRAQALTGLTRWAPVRQLQQHPAAADLHVYDLSRQSDCSDQAECHDPDRVYAGSAAIRHDGKDHPWGADHGCDRVRQRTPYLPLAECCDEHLER